MNTGSDERAELEMRLDTLRREHREMDDLIKELSARPYLTPEDQVQIARLKKLKLRKKDEMISVASLLGLEL